MRDLVVDLRRLTRQTTDPAALYATPARRRWQWAALLPVLLVTGFLAWQAWRASHSGEPLRAVALTTFAGEVRYPSFSPDGNYLAFTWTGPSQDNPHIYVQMTGSVFPLRLTTHPLSDY